MKLVLFFVAFLSCVPYSASTGGFNEKEVTEKNQSFEVAVADVNQSSGLSIKAQGFLNATMGPTTGVSPKGFRLWAEGSVIALVLKKLYTATADSETLILSGYNDNGATTFPLAKERSRRNELVTMLLLPADDGSRGDHGIIKGPPHPECDVMESDLRAWNKKNGNRITFVTLFDVADITDTSEHFEIFKTAAAEKESLVSLIQKTHTALETAKKNNEEAPEKNDNYLEAVAELERCNPTYYTKEGAPRGDLDIKIAAIINAILKDLESKNFKHYFEGSGAHHFSTIHGTAVSYPVLKFLAKKKGVVSLDHPFGSTDIGLHSEHQYLPNTMIIIFLRKSLLAKDTNKSDSSERRGHSGEQYQLHGVRVIQLDWNDIALDLFDALTLEVHDLNYASPSKSVVTETHRIANLFEYRVLLTLDILDADKVWNLLHID